MSALACKDVDERLIDYLYDELDASDEQEIRAHVEGCARCQSEVAAFRRVRKAAAELPVEEPSPSLTLSLMEAAAAHHAPAVQGAIEAAFAAAPPRLSIVPPLAPEPLPPLGGAKAAPSGGHAAPTAARGPRRWYRHPGFAAAASFLVVGAGTAYFMTTQPSLVYESLPPQRVAATPALPAEPSPSAPQPLVVKKLDAPPERIALEPPSMAGNGSSRGALPAAAPSRMAAHRYAAGDDALGGLADFEGGGSAAKRAGRPAGVVAVEEARPAARREAVGHGLWLGPNENGKLAESVRSAAPSAPAPEAAPPPQPQPAVAQRDNALRDDRARSALEARRVEKAAPETEQFAQGDDKARMMPKKKQAPPAQRADSLDETMGAAPPAAPPAGRVDDDKARADRATDLQMLVARFNALSMNRHCDRAISVYDDIRRSHPEHTFSVEDRKQAANCLYTIERYSEARREAQAIVGVGSPDQREFIEGLLRKIDNKLGIPDNSRRLAVPAEDAPRPQLAAPGEAAPSKAAPPRDNLAKRASKHAAPPRSGKKAQTVRPADTLDSAQ